MEESASGAKKRSKSEWDGEERLAYQLPTLETYEFNAKTEGGIDAISESDGTGFHTS